MVQEQRPDELTPRRKFLKRVGQGTVAALFGGALVGGALRARGSDLVWQIDPAKCTACGECQKLCVREISAAKAMHTFPICGYCDYCFAYLRDDYLENDTGAENLRCPTGALQRRHIGVRLRPVAARPEPPSGHKHHALGWRRVVGRHQPRAMPLDREPAPTGDADRDHDDHADREPRAAPGR